MWFFTNVFMLPQGSPGFRGQPGPQGHPGVDGVQGSPGPPGDTGTPSMSSGIESNPSPHIRNRRHRYLCRYLFNYTSHSIAFLIQFVRLVAFVLISIILRPCQHDDTNCIDGRSQIKVHADERTQVHSARSSLVVTHPSTNRGIRCLISVNVPLS